MKETPWLVPALLAAALHAPAWADAAAQAGFESKAAAIEADIVRYDAIDPAFPPALNAHFRYVALLAGDDLPDCAARIDKAAAHLRHLTETAATTVLLHDGRARLASLRQRLAQARADCSGDPAQEGEYLLEALQAASEAVAAFRDVHDYPDMAIAQFNVAFDDRALGHMADSVAALRTAIDMDWRYGLRDDAKENLRTLAEWTGTDNSDKAIAAAMENFPKREVELAFGWKPHAGAVDTSSESDASQGGGFRHVAMEAHGTYVLSRRGDDILEKDRGVVSLAGFPDAPAELRQKLEDALNRLMDALPTVVISKDGSFAGMEGVDDYDAQARGLVESLPGEVYPEGDPKRDELGKVLRERFGRRLGKEAVLERARMNHHLLVGLWTGTTLAQADWRELDDTLEMIGTPDGRIKSTLDFAFTGLVPCTPDSADAHCAELLVDAAPDDDALKAVADRLSADGKGSLHYWSRLHYRLVVDPDTLATYQVEMGKEHFMKLGVGRGSLSMGSERTTGHIRVDPPVTPRVDGSPRLTGTCTPSDRADVAHVDALALDSLVPAEGHPASAATTLVARLTYSLAHDEAGAYSISPQFATHAKGTTSDAGLSTARALLTCGRAGTIELSLPLAVPMADKDVAQPLQVEFLLLRSDGNKTSRPVAQTAPSRFGSRKPGAAGGRVAPRGRAL